MKIQKKNSAPLRPNRVKNKHSIKITPDLLDGAVDFVDFEKPVVAVSFVLTFLFVLSEIFS